MKHSLFLAAVEATAKTVRTLLTTPQLTRPLRQPFTPECLRGEEWLAGPLDDGDLLAAAEEERDVWEPRLEKCVDCGKDFEVGHYAGHSLHCKGPWWAERAVEAKAAKTEPCAHSYGDLDIDAASETATCRCGVKFITKVFGRVSSDADLKKAYSGGLLFPPTTPDVASAGASAEDPSAGEGDSSAEADSRCKFCQQHVKQLEDGLWFHPGRNRLRCTDITTYPITYAAPE